MYRDEVGGIGTPTSDEERTKITIDTSHIHININAFATEMPLSEMIPWVESLLVEFAQASSITSFVIYPNLNEMHNR